MPHAAGMKFFPGYVNDARRQALDAAAFRWNQTGQEHKKLLKWGDRSQLQGGLLMLEAPTPQAVSQKGKQAKQRQALPAGETASSRGTGAVALVTGRPVWRVLSSTGQACFDAHRLVQPCRHASSQPQLLFVSLVAVRGVTVVQVSSCVVLGIVSTRT